MNVYEPTFLVTIEGQTLSRDLTQEITSLVFEDNEEESDLLELTVLNRHGRFTDDPLFQEGNTIEVTRRLLGLFIREGLAQVLRERGFQLLVAPHAIKDFLACVEIVLRHLPHLGVGVLEERLEGRHGRFHGLQGSLVVLLISR